MKRSYLIIRLANMSVLVILLMLALASIGAAILDQQATGAAESSTYLATVYRQALYEISVEESVQYEYVLNPSPFLKEEHLQADNTLLGLLHTLQGDGEPDDIAVARQIMTEQTHYMLAAGQFFAAVDDRDLARARAIHYQNIDPVFVRIQQQMQDQAAEEQAKATHDLAKLAQDQHLTLMMTPIMFAVGLLFMTISAWIIKRFHQKIDQASRDEVRRLEQIALIDPLTGLGNHYAYQERLAQAVEQAHRDETPLVLALLNLDEFKLFNDEQGHQRGDEVLFTIAALLQEARLSDALFRLNGDDFALIICGTPLAEATLALDRFREDVKRKIPGMTVSVGVVNAAITELDREILSAQAIAALQEAKRRGRNRVLTFEQIKASVSIIPSTKIQSLRRLLREGSVNIAFQPIWNLTTNTVLAFEALTRPPADFGFAGPQELFDVAEHVGRAHELDVLCVQAILDHAADLPSNALLFLNLTPQTLVHDLLTGAALLEAVVTAGLTPSRVVLEITERSIVELAEVIQKVKFLRLMGFQVALDDAGAGNAGLEMLSQLSIDFVKIDRAVIGHALTDRAARSVLAGIVTIARESHISVIAEGIENPEMLDLVKRFKVQNVQGYLLGRPNETIPTIDALQALSSALYTASHEASVDGGMALSTSES